MLSRSWRAPGRSLTNVNTMRVSTARKKATQKSVRDPADISPIDDSKPYATSGLTTAPALSSALCTPNERPRFAGSALKVSQASRGGLRKPLPSRSTTRKAPRPVIEVDTSRIVLARVEKAYPASLKILRLPLRSESQPAR